MANYERTKSGKTTRLLLDMSIEELCNFLFEGYKLRYPDDKNETLDLVLINTDTELDEIYSCHASSYDIKGQLVLWNWRNF